MEKLRRIRVSTRGWLLLGLTVVLALAAVEGGRRYRIEQDIRERQSMGGLETALQEAKHVLPGWTPETFVLPDGQGRERDFATLREGTQTAVVFVSDSENCENFVRFMHALHERLGVPKPVQIVVTSFAPEREADFRRRTMFEGVILYEAENGPVGTEWMAASRPRLYYFDEKGRLATATDPGKTAIQEMGMTYGKGLQVASYGGLINLMKEYMGQPTSPDDLPNAPGRVGPPDVYADY